MLECEYRNMEIEKLSLCLLFFSSKGIKNMSNLARSSIRINLAYSVGMKLSESSFCCAVDSGNAAMPEMMPATMKMSEMKDQTTPQHCDEPPYRLANTLASDSLTLRRMRSSQISQTL